MGKLDKVIQLIGYESTGELDDDGNEIPAKREKKINAEELSPGQKEFSIAGQSGLRASKVFKVYAHEFNDETELKYQSKIYSIYRTFRKGNRIELFCEVRLGGKH